MVGPTGTGKSLYPQNVLFNKLPIEQFVPATIAFTIQISAKTTQELLISKLLKLRRGVYGMGNDRTCVLFVDDLNTPAKEKYGAQPPLELLRQIFDYHYIYDIKETHKISIHDLLIIAACGLPGGSRQSVYERFLCHFNIFAINEFSNETMTKIFSGILLHGLQSRGHGLDIASTVNQIVGATIRIFLAVNDHLRPTPNKSHYVYNLRDIARVCAGCALLRKESSERKSVFAKLWMHETMRVFGDRLIDDDDRQWLFGRIDDAVGNVFKESAFDGDADESSVNAMQKLMFASYMDLDTPIESRRYEEVANEEKLRQIATDVIAEYNSCNKSQMHIVLFSYALQHLNRICRMLSLPSGNSLLVGMGGSGRRTIVRLAAVLMQQTVFEPQATKNYGENEWHEDIKRILKEAGGHDRDCVFLLLDDQIARESFLSDVDCLLNLGEVPNIWKIDERQELVEMVRLKASKSGLRINVDNPLELYTYFVSKCKEKLHVILCFSPIGTSFRTKIRLYAALVNCCTLDWFDAWPEDALRMVAHSFLADVDVQPTIKEAIVRTCQYFHVTARDQNDLYVQQTMRSNYVTSASYMGLLSCFSQLFARKQSELYDQRTRYERGLQTLLQASESIAKMQAELESMQPQLRKMAKDTAIMMDDIAKQNEEAQHTSEQIRQDEIVANAQADAAEIMDVECTNDLAQAMPALEEALGALDTLKPSDITLVKSMKNPPAVVKLVMAAVCVMKGIPPDSMTKNPATGKSTGEYWNASKRMLSDFGFLASLRDYDRDHIPADVIQKIRKDFIPHPSFVPSIVAKSSSAAKGLCQWVVAMDKYEAVSAIVMPKQRKLNEVREVLANTKAMLNEKRRIGDEINRRVQELNVALAAANAEKTRIETEVAISAQKLLRAEKIIENLGGERSRWTEIVRIAYEYGQYLMGDILIASGVISYLAPFTSPHRSMCLQAWHRAIHDFGLTASTPFNFIKALGSDVVIQNWTLNSLPTDTFSVENAIIMDNSLKYCLFVDPQRQANNWIKSMEHCNSLKTTKLSNADFFKSLETCLEFGRPLLIENIGETLDAALDLILQPNTFYQGTSKFISIGDKNLPFSPNFRLYLTTSLSNPHYGPEACNKVTIINFVLTIHGLEDQLLDVVVAKERPDLDEQRRILISTNAENRRLLVDIENNILNILGQSEGDILENEEATEVFEKSKRISTEIATKQEVSRKTEHLIQAFRESYRDVAKRSSLLYYCVADLIKIDAMYQFSVNWYRQLYVMSIENANKSREVERRVQILQDAITRNLYNNVCRSIFEKDKLLFSFMLTMKILSGKGNIAVEELEFLLAFDSGDTKQPNPQAQWLPDRVWIAVNALEKLQIFKGFVRSFLDNITPWRTLYESKEPHLMVLPPPWCRTLNNFHQLFVMKALRSDKIAKAIFCYVEKEMGAEFVTPPQFNIAQSYDDSASTTPIVFVLSEGTDPMDALLNFVGKMGNDGQFQSISLGQGQGPIAQKMIAEAQASGAWICLQNCHLMPSFMGTLEMICENMNAGNTLGEWVMWNDRMMRLIFELECPTGSFRMWLTTYPTEKFPSTILQNSVKVTNEPPTGLQQNLIRCYNSEPLCDPNFYNGTLCLMCANQILKYIWSLSDCPGKEAIFARLLFGISFFHAVAQERKKFGALGWNIPYGFNDTDFQISTQQVRLLLNQYEETPFNAITYLTGECNWGGRVTDSWDRRLLTTILKDYVNEASVKAAYTFGGMQSIALPTVTDHRRIVDYIHEQIPNNPSPEVFGLHANAGITRDQDGSQHLFASTMRAFGFGDSGGTSGGTLDAHFAESIREISSKLPANFDIEVCIGKYPIDYHESMNTVLIQEMQRFNVLLNEIRHSFQEVLKAVNGSIQATNTQPSEID